MMKQLSILSFILLSYLPLQAELPDTPVGLSHSMQNFQSEPKLTINNRPLAKVNGKVITLTDVVKKMDYSLFEYDPNAILSAVEKYHYYMSRYSHTLDDMIANELILLDAKQKEVKVSDGEVREELEKRFGPYIMSNLDKINMSYEEARDMIREDLTIQQLIGMKVHSKAFQSVTPQLVKEAYQEYVEKNPAQDSMTYQVLSVRGKNQEACEAYAKEIYATLEKTGCSLAEASESVASEDSEVTITVSEDFQTEANKISEQHFAILKTLSEDKVSEPVTQQSRHDKSSAVRLFHLKDKKHIEPNGFDSMHDNLKNELLYKTADQMKNEYITSLKKRFGYETHNPKQELPADYRPFQLS